MSKRTQSIKTSSPTLRSLFSAAKLSGITLDSLAESCNTHQARLSGYRTGRNQPGILIVEEMAGALGYRLALVPLDDPDKPR